MSATPRFNAARSSAIRQMLVQNATQDARRSPTLSKQIALLVTLVVAAVAVAGGSAALALGVHPFQFGPPAPAHTSPALTPTPTATPVPTSTPISGPTTPPALSALVLSTKGLGPLLIGSAVPEQPRDTTVVRWDPTACGSGGAWLAHYPNGPIGPGGDPTGPPFYFSVAHEFDPLTYINVSSTQIKTSTGISIGDTLAQLKAAYPHFDKVTKGPQTTLYELDGAKAKLVIEVGRTGMPAEHIGKVVLMEVNPLGSAPGSLYGNGAGGGICPGGE